MHPILVLLIGTSSGLNSASWGAYKDSPYEGFKPLTFARSVLLAIVLAFLTCYIFQQAGIPVESPLVLFAFVVAVERILTEIYKAFFRDESQAKYAIPSEFHVTKRLVHDKPRKLGYLALTVGSLLLLFTLAQFTNGLGAPPLLMGLIWGFVAGLYIDLGGALKDAPFEGFQPLKFFRSSAVAMLWGGALSLLTTQYGLLFGAAAGMERMSVEFYKSFIVRQVPGKFRGDVRFEDWKTKRRMFIFPYAVSWLGFLCLAFVY